MSKTFVLNVDMVSLNSYDVLSLGVRPKSASLRVPPPPITVYVHSEFQTGPCMIEGNQLLHYFCIL